MRSAWAASSSVLSVCRARRTQHHNAKAHYTPPTPTRLNCPVDSRRRCTSQLVGDSLDESEQIRQQRIRVASCRRRERTRRQSWIVILFTIIPVLSSYWGWCQMTTMTPLLKFNIDQNSRSQTAMVSVSNCRPNRIRRQSWASCEFCSHYTPPTPTRFNSTVESRRRRLCNIE